MFQIDDIVVYGRNGVCRITNIGTISMSMADRHRQYYTLKPLFGHDAVLYVPVDREGSVMRPVMTREEAEALIDEMPEIACTFSANEREREAQYKEALRTCDGRELVKIIKLMYGRKQMRIRQGKKMTSVDERYMNLARERLCEELGYALDIAKGSVEAYIADNIMAAGHRPAAQE